MGKSLIIPDHSFSLKPGRVVSGSNTKGQQTLE